jgi:hypothetical protein
MSFQIVIPKNEVSESSITSYVKLHPETRERGIYATPKPTKPPGNLVREEFEEVLSDDFG